MLKLRVLVKNTDTHAQRERTWATTSSWGGKEWVVEHFPVKGSRVKGDLFFWPDGQSWYTWSPDVFMGSDDSFLVVWVGF